MIQFSPMVSIERINELFRLDPSTGRIFWKVAANSQAPKGSVAGNLTSYGYRRVQIDGKSYREHNIVYALAHGRHPSAHLDHVNGVRDDNRPDNLREATRSENNCNKGTEIRNKSGVKGVSWRADRGKWWAQIVKSGKIHRLGYFTNIDEAAAAYRMAAEQHHGEFARTA